MKAILLVTLAMLVMLPLQHVNAEEIPAWIKNNAKWWADGTISDSDFVQGIQFLVTQDIIKVPETTQGHGSSTQIPVWIKNNAKWWADGTISDSDFVQGIQFLIRGGIMTVGNQQIHNTSSDLEMEACQEKKNQRERLQCEREIKTKQEVEEFKVRAVTNQVGPITFYTVPATVERSGGKDIVNLKFLVENTGSKSAVTMFCTGPAACNYDLSDGQTTYKYSANDFVSGQIVLREGQQKFINILFGPAIGYGSYVDFKFDPQRQYTFNVKEPWGSAGIPMDLR